MKVKFFAHLKTLTGCDEADLPLPPARPAINACELWALLEERFPGIAAHQSSTRLACNFAYAEPDTLFGEEDEVALIPPVSGG